MQKQIRNTALAVFSTVAVFFTYTALADDTVAQMQNNCQLAMQNLQNADSTIGPFFTNSAGYAVFPEVGKGGFIIGGARGKGLVFEKGNPNPIAKTTMTQASIGAQIGGQTFDEVIFFDTPASLNNFKQGGFQMSADVSAVAVAQGAGAAAKYTQGVLVFTLPRSGLMAQASVGGQNFTYEPITK
jgi:lipid-binding SYLF domain-containing protein